MLMYHYQIKYHSQDEWMDAHIDFASIAYIINDTYPLIGINGKEFYINEEYSVLLYKLIPYKKGR